MMMHFKKMILAVMALAALTATAACGKKNEYAKTIPEDLKLVSYSNGWGGNENGNYYEEIVKRMDNGEVLYGSSKTDYYWADSVIEEYRMDEAVLEEIEAIFRKYKMGAWNNMEFSDMHVDDGETESFHFGFGTEHVNFSSQIFPEKYREKLKEIDAVIKKHLETAEKLPGLAKAPMDPQTAFESGRFTEGEVTFSVYEYFDNYLYYRVGNGTGETIQVPDRVALKKADGSVIFEEEDAEGYVYEVEPKDSTEKTIRLEERLEPGQYVLEFGDMTCEFEIR